MTRRMRWVHVLAWGPPLVCVSSGAGLFVMGHVTTWVANEAGIYVSETTPVWPAGLVVLGAGAIGCVAAGLLESVNLARRK